MDNQQIFKLCDTIRETAFSLQGYLRHGHAEKCYENGLKNRLRKSGIKVDQQVPLVVFDEDGSVLGDFVADLIVENEIIIELKAIKTLTSDHTAQILGYMRACNKEHGLLINFGAPKLQVSKYILSQI